MQRLYFLYHRDLLGVSFDATMDCQQALFSADPATAVLEAVPSGGDVDGFE